MSQHLLKPKSSSPIWMLFSIVLLAAASFGLVQQLIQVWNHTNQLQNKIASLKKRIADKPKRTLSKVQQEEQKRWAALAIEFEYPWQVLLHAVERAGHPDIELLEFQPAKASRSVLLAGEAKTQKSLEEFLRNLERDETLTAVHLTHQEIIQRDRLSTVAFEIKALLK